GDATRIVCRPSRHRYLGQIVAGAAQLADSGSPNHPGHHISKFTMGSREHSSSSANLRMRQKQILITGGAGFIGVNAARAFLVEGWHVTVLDNLSRQGANRNLDWLRGCGTFDFERADLSHYDSVTLAFAGRKFDY